MVGSVCYSCKAKSKRPQQSDVLIEFDSHLIFSLISPGSMYSL